MNELRPWHIIVLVIVLFVLFGYKKLPDATRSLGRSLRILKSEVKTLKDDEGKDSKDAKDGSEPEASAQPRTVAAPRAVEPPRAVEAPRSVVAPSGTEDTPKVAAGAQQSADADRR
jgi:sec-independent protein translocase protein TatA